MRWLMALAALLVVAGCDEPRPSAKAKVQPREILNKRTQDVRDASKEIGAGQAVEIKPKIVAKDPITLAGNAYVTAIGKTSIGLIEHALNLYQAEHGEYPKTYEEFMTNIIKANNIALPTLPAYQEYGYDAKEHRLILLEYPDKKAAMGR